VICLHWLWLLVVPLAFVLGMWMNGWEDDE
jgi:cytochrome b561